MFKEHGVMPSVIYSAPYGERVLLSAMHKIELETMEKEDSLFAKFIKVLLRR
jgi:hypothetical protein